MVNFSNSERADMVMPYGDGQVGPRIVHQWYVQHLVLPSSLKLTIVAAIRSKDQLQAEEQILEHVEK